MDETATNQSFVTRVPDGDDRERLVCDTCGFVNYQNPQLVVGSVVTWEGQVLLCRRAIMPRVGFWTLPAGYMELGESPDAGARREAWEEARARIRIRDLLAVYSIQRLSQVQLIYRAELEDPVFKAGPESQEVALFPWAEIPWEELAFPSVHWALTQFHAVREQNQISPFTNPPEQIGDMNELNQPTS